MTIAGWAILIIVSAISITVAWVISIDCYETKSTIIAFIVAALIIISTFCALSFYYHNTESGKRQVRTQKSDFSGGLNRTVSVYSYDGKILGQWTGKFDVTEDDKETYFDIDGKRVIIQGGIIINEEK